MYNIESHLAQIEAHVAQLRAQGWTQADFAGALSAGFGERPKELAAEVLPDRSVSVGAAVTFDANEGAYIRAAAGNQVSGAEVSPVGITDTQGRRWLLGRSVSLLGRDSTDKLDLARYM